MRRNRYQERAVIIPAGDIVLEGLWQRGEEGPACVIAAPHPDFGGSMDSAVVAEIAFGAAHAGSPTLRFNYRGVGGSQGVSTATETEVSDFVFAADHLLETNEREEYFAVGYSFGAWIATHAVAQDPRAVGLVLVSPANTMLDFTVLETIRHRPVLLLYGGKDDIVDAPALLALTESNPLVSVELVKDGDHTFTRGLANISRVVGAWLAKRAAAGTDE